MWLKVSGAVLFTAGSLWSLMAVSANAVLSTDERVGFTVPATLVAVGLGMFVVARFRETA